MELPVRVAAVVLLMAGCYAAYRYAPSLVQSTFLGEFSFLVPACAVLLFLCLAHWIAHRAGWEA